MTTVAAAASQTQPNNSAGVQSVPTQVTRQVTYVIRITTGNGVVMPYAIAVNGIALPAFADRPLQVASGREITVRAAPGSEVSLFLNSDAHPAYRQSPVYAVVVSQRDARIVITEKPGQHSDSDDPALAATTESLDTYAAALTGDIWMRVTHKYTEAEVAGLLPDGTNAGVALAVRSIYTGLAAATLQVSEAVADSAAARHINVTFIDSENPRANITAYALLADGLARVHPAGYAAIFTAALSSGVGSVRVTSCWRPMLGSIAHRAGLGLDVDYVGPTRINRQELRGGVDTTNVSEQEKVLFREYEQAQRDYVQADHDAQAAARAAVQSGNSADRVQSAREARTRADIARRKRDEASADWNAERDANEPVHVRRFRQSLLECPRVLQVFDPWLMDSNTRDDHPPDPNQQRGPTGSNERLHSHHLHVTVREPRIR